MASSAVLVRLQQRAAQTDQIISQLRSQIKVLKTNAVVNACQNEEEKLRKENTQLTQEVGKLKQTLIQCEIRNGMKQYQLPSSPIISSAVGTTPQNNAVNVDKQPMPPVLDDGKKKKGVKPKNQNQPKGGNVEDKPVDVSRLDMRIGFIVNAKKHPDADGLYVEEVDLGEEKNRTIVSGLVKFVPLEEMQNRHAIFVCNLKPAKMRGIVSQGMIMCASSPEKVEIIVPPNGAAVGDKVTVDGYEGVPDSVMNPKKKIFEQVQPDLTINADGVATYKGVPWKIENIEGLCKVPTMRNTIIK